MEPRNAQIRSSLKRWQSPSNVERYDRHPELPQQEKEALACFVTHFTGRMRSWPAATKPILHRLVQPLQEVLDFLHSAAKYRATPLAVILHERHERGVAYWAWSEEEWQEILQPNFKAVQQRYPNFTDQTVRLELLAIGYFVCPLTDLSSSLLRSVQPVPLARRLFGSERLDLAVKRLYRVIMSWGYNTGNHKQELTQALAEAFIAHQSPYLEDLTFPLLASLAEKTRWHLRHSLGRLSRALEHLGLIDGSLPRTGKHPDITGRIDTTGIAAGWTEWGIRWYRFSGLATRTKNNYLHVLLRTGRWLAAVHPEMTTPHQWTTQVAAEYVASLEEIHVGEYVAVQPTKTILPRVCGKPLSARSKDRHLAIMRAFFKDLQDDPHLVPRRFDPVRTFRTPRAIRNQMSPNPRHLGPLLWAKLVHAALNLPEEDLPRMGGREANRGLRYPLALVRAVAVVWVYSGLRCDEIVRLPLGCIRWQQEDVTIPETGEVLPKEATCFLTVPVNKTTTSFQKPVNPLVGKRINEWEQVRAAGQPPQTDRKTGAVVN